MTSRLRLVAAAALTLAVLPLGATASAETWTRTDPAGDALVFSADVDGDGERDPGNETADIRRVSVRHTARTVTVTLRFRDLRGGASMLMGTVATPGQRFEVLAMRGPDYRMFVLQGSDSEPDEVGRDCRGKRLAHDTAKDRIRMSIPRSCLGDPAWVRVGATYLTGSLLTSIDEDGEAHADDAMSTGDRLGSVERPRLSPKVRVG